MSDLNDVKFVSSLQYPVAAFSSTEIHWVTPNVNESPERYFTTRSSARDRSEPFVQSGNSSNRRSSKQLQVGV